MLEKKVPFCIDHFSIATTHRDRPIDLVTKLGFTTADCYTDRTVHFIFENSYPAQHRRKGTGTHRIRCCQKYTAFGAGSSETPGATPQY